jgi:hypothetical protein
MMRTLIAGLIFLLAGSAFNAASAEVVYPWCAHYAGKNGGTNCGFSTLQQCQWAISGNGGICSSNLNYHVPQRPAFGRAYRR